MSFSCFEPPGAGMVPVALRAPYTIPAPQPCSVLIPRFEVTNSETAGLLVEQIMALQKMSGV
jgi:hypothetical protein